MRNLMISVGEYQFFDEPSIKAGFIGGKIIAANPTTKEEVFRTYKRFHTGKTNKYNVLAKFIVELVPPEEEKTEKNTTCEGLGEMDAPEEKLD